ncbi:UNVERIFIED_CONTAM: hypothetical protein FKN15_002061 [Acipenser sinensis]
MVGKCVQTCLNVFCIVCCWSPDSGDSLLSVCGWPVVTWPAKFTWIQKVFGSNKSKDIQFGKNENSLDVYFPTAKGFDKSSARLPALIYVFGGGWESGSRTMYCLLAQQLANDLNVVVICTDYSLYPKCTIVDMVQDLIDCIGWTRDHGHSYGIDKKIFCCCKRYLESDLDQHCLVCRLPPFVLLHGIKDKVVPVDSSLRFSSALLVASVKETLHVLPDVDHTAIVMDLMDRNRSSYTTLHEHVRKELQNIYF